ncbi:MAG: hypothetical protein Q4F50_11755 [Bacteroides sp.]|uniref:hypothetical protein n=1 Tax=Bacteroides sp. TaxID=29523 RepID=UPI0026DFBCA2|nr:hypothetical protein [Bacteroides sp.]MDO5420723.1 hypothetical protein [Bacteroides sp.]
MEYIILFLIIVVSYITRGCWRSDFMYQATMGIKRPKKKKEPDDPEKYGWLTKKLHESNVRGAEKNRQLKEEIRQMKEHNAQLREVIHLQKEEKRKKKEEALRLKEEEKQKEKERKRLLKEEKKQARQRRNKHCQPKHLANFSTNEQNYSVLLRYFSFVYPLIPIVY